MIRDRNYDKVYKEMLINEDASQLAKVKADMKNIEKDIKRMDAEDVRIVTKAVDDLLAKSKSQADFQKYGAQAMTDLANMDLSLDSAEVQLVMTYVMLKAQVR